MPKRKAASRRSTVNGVADEERCCSTGRLPVCLDYEELEEPGFPMRPPSPSQEAVLEAITMALSEGKLVRMDVADR